VNEGQLDVRVLVDEMSEPKLAECAFGAVLLKRFSFERTLLREVNGLCSLFGFLEKQNCKKILFVSRSEYKLNCCLTTIVTLRQLRSQLDLARD